MQPPAPSLVRRAFSLSGVFPLGAFLVFHLGLALRALSGDAAFASALDALHRRGALVAAEVALVLLPLLFHAGFGVWLTAAREPLADPSPHSPPVTAALRVTGVVLAVFLALHLGELGLSFVPPWPSGGATATRLAAHLSSTRLGIPWRGVGYLVAVGCMSFHFVAGCWGFYARSAHGRAALSRRRSAAVLAAVAGCALGLAFADVVVFEATGMRLVGKAALGGATQACP